MHRPTGVSILAIFSVITGILAIPTGLGLLSNITSEPELGLATVRSTAASIVAALGSIFVVLGVLLLVFGIGAWQLRHWAWRLGIGLAVVNIPLVFVGWVLQGFSVLDVFPLIVSLIVVYYLFQPDVQRAFGRT